MRRQRLFFWSVTAALAGFLFGFHTTVISGTEQKTESIWKLAPGMHGTCEPAWIFAFFCLMMLLQLAWVKLMVPETKGTSLEQMQHKLGIHGA